MKSKEAKKYLSSSAMGPNSPLAQDQDYVWRYYSIIKAIEIAENEMIEKALEAYKFACEENYDGECWAFGGFSKCCGQCAGYNEFKQKMMEG